MYLPTSHEEDVLVNAQLKSFESDAISVFDLDKGAQFESRDGEKIFDDGNKFFNFKVSLKKLKLRDNLHGYFSSWADEFTHDEQFDYVVQTKNSHAGVQLFKMLSFNLNPLDDIILVKLDGEFDTENEYADIKQGSLTMAL